MQVHAARALIPCKAPNLDASPHHTYLRSQVRNACRSPPLGMVKFHHDPTAFNRHCWQTGNASPDHWSNVTLKRLIICRPIPLRPLRIKDQARRLRADLTKRGHDTTHSQALEMLAHQMGQRDWNTLAALAQRATAPAPLTLGARIAGRYLGQDVAGTVLAIAAHAGLTRLTIKLDEPVDVVRFDSFSSLRRRITVSLNDAGVTPQRTSDGQPHFVRLAA